MYEIDSDDFDQSDSYIPTQSDLSKLRKFPELDGYSILEIIENGIVDIESEAPIASNETAQTEEIFKTKLFTLLNKRGNNPTDIEFIKIKKALYAMSNVNSLNEVSLEEWVTFAKKSDNYKRLLNLKQEEEELLKSKFHFASKNNNKRLNLNQQADNIENYERYRSFLDRYRFYAFEAGLYTNTIFDYAQAMQEMTRIDLDKEKVLKPKLLQAVIPKYAENTVSDLYARNGDLKTYLKFKNYRSKRLESKVSAKI